MRKILTPLLVIPLGMLIYVCIYPGEHPGLEYIFLLIGLPVLALNYFAWFQPEILQAYFPVKEKGGQGTAYKPTTRTLVIGGLIVFVFLGLGAVAAISRAGASPILETPAVRRAEYTATPTFIVLPSKIVVSNQDENQTAVFSRPTQTPQISPSPEAPADQAASSGTPGTETASVTGESTITVTPTGPAASGRCVVASADFIGAVSQVVEDADSDNEVESGWGVESNALDDLWFIAAKVHGPQIEGGITVPGVWGVFLYGPGDFDIYAINQVAMDYSYSAWGEDNDPIITMDTDGAQAAYNCATGD